MSQAARIIIYNSGIGFTSYSNLIVIKMPLYSLLLIVSPKYSFLPIELNLLIATKGDLNLLDPPKKQKQEHIVNFVFKRMSNSFALKISAASRLLLKNKSTSNKIYAKRFMF
jgi:hypothetical protein